MTEPIPDLWRADEDAGRLYQLYLARLEMNGQHERMVSACRTIRRYAARGPGALEGQFTYHIEIDALCELGRYEAAWRQLRRLEAHIFGSRADPARRDWSSADAGWTLAFCAYSPLLYFMGRYRTGCAVLEGALALHLEQMKGRSYEILCCVYNQDDEPTNRCRVTLSHFYRRLGKPLTQWRDWDAFVMNLHPKLFRVAAISRDQLLADAAQLPLFFDRLREVLDERLATSTTDGQSDLIDSAAAVKGRQQRRQRQLDDFDERIAPVRERTDQKLGELFPELR